MGTKSLTKAGALLAAGALMVGLAACSPDTGNGAGGTDSPDKVYTFRVSYPSPAVSAGYLKMEELEERLLEKSDGRIVLELYSDAQIGTTNESVQAVENGEDLISYTDSATIAAMVKGDGKYLDILSGPFLFESTEEGLNFLKGDVYEELVSALEEESSISVISLNWLEGQRNMVGNKAYPEPSDMEKQRIRVPPIETWTRTFDLIGAVPTTVEYAEVFSALEQGVVDGTENGIPAMLTSRYYEAVTEVTLTKHFMPFYGFVINQDVLAAMPDDLRTLLIDEFNAAGEELALADDQATAEAIVELEKQGVTVHEANIPAYKEITAPFYDAYPEGLVDRIRESAK